MKKTLTNNDGTKKVIIYVIDLVTPVLVKTYKNNKFTGSKSFKNIDVAQSKINTWFAN